jgi:hypothetical protein
MTTDRTDEFTPLVATAPPRDSREFQITVIPQNEQAQSFQSLGRKAATVSPNKNGEPELTLQRDGSRITHIRIQCNCGQTHEIECVYEEPASGKGQGQPKTAAPKEPRERKEKK